MSCGAEQIFLMSWESFVQIMTPKQTRPLCRAVAVKNQEEETGYNIVFGCRSSLANLTRWDDNDGEMNERSKLQILPAYPSMPMH